MATWSDVVSVLGWIITWMKGFYVIQGISLWFIVQLSVWVMVAGIILNRVTRGAEE